jgi:hypothetical protein
MFHLHGIGAKLGRFQYSNVEDQNAMPQAKQPVLATSKGHDSKNQFLWSLPPP